MSHLSEIVKISSQLPFQVLQDIDKRCCDWMAAGGHENDPYIAQQLRYANNFINRKEAKK